MRQDLYPLADEDAQGLLVRLTEECAEVIKACSKAIRFGLENYHPDYSEPYRNAREIANELADVLLIRDELFKRRIIP